MPSYHELIRNYETACANLREFKERNQQFFARLSMLLYTKKIALEKLEQAVRSGEIPVSNEGPVCSKKKHTQLDKDKLLQQIGRDKFSMIGGKIEETYSISIEKARHAVRNGHITPEVLASCTKVTDVLEVEEVYAGLFDEPEEAT
jgi:hypothetical protein